MSLAPQSFKVLTTLAAQRIVSHVTGTANTVHYPAANTEMMVGITKDTVLETGTSIAVLGPGSIARLLFNQTVASGELVTADSVGRGVVFTAVTAPTSYVGVVLGGVIDATGTVAEVLINPGWKSIP